MQGVVEVDPELEDPARLSPLTDRQAGQPGGVGKAVSLGREGKTTSNTRTYGAPFRSRAYMLAVDCLPS